MAPLMSAASLALASLSFLISPSNAAQPSCISLGCYNDGPARSLDGGVTFSSGDSPMTIEKCAVIASGYLFYGLEYGGECWYGNTLKNGAGPTPSSASTYTCDMTCAGDSTENCGGSYALNLFCCGTADACAAAAGIATTTTSTQAPTTTAKSVCRRDNCLRNLLNRRYSSSATAFCATYTTSVNTNPAAIPTYLKNCAGATASVSSACSCLAQPTKA